MRYLRKKGYWKSGEARYIIEEKIGGRSVYIETLPPIDLLLEAIRQDASRPKASQEQPKASKDESTKGAQSPLTEPAKQDAKTKEAPLFMPDEEQLRKLWELTK